MMGHGYTGGKPMPQIEYKRKFAWHPVCVSSGNWVWGRHYIKRMKIYWGPAGEFPAIDSSYYTEGEWFLKKIEGTTDD